MKTKVSIIVLNWNGKNHLRKCLKSIEKISYKPLEVIVVDNDSKDTSCEMVEKEFQWVKLVRNTSNMGYSGGNNIGIKASKGKYILILNNDTEVTEDFLSPLVEVLDSDKKVACAQPKLLYGDNRNLLNAVGSYFTSTGFLYHYGYRKNAKLATYNEPLSIYSAKGAAMLLRKSVLQKVGLFDEDFFIFFEETDLCHRLWLSGYTVKYEPSSVIYHYEAVDTSKQMKDFTRNYLSFRNRIASYIKNLEIINMVKVLFFLSVIYSFLCLYYIFNLKPHLLLAIAAGVGWNIIRLPNTLKKRNNVQSKIRRISDAELFLHIKRNPPLKYYYYLFTTLKNFKDEKAIQ